ncbi:hypothetical protein FEM48_Zijuj04G0116600 [Ziziphus jujuba var. spinosa]|uniref:Uncharacterized protein n=1 Tax=Ziziphus jujuba var. spinosa TaxID=714518 RepID=A0A978VJN6_ZIZJJ|nr:hypothetical protein FEM48_Zijuj04G0116600 [Ziziphus jujuba var. spinosa]
MIAVANKGYRAITFDFRGGLSNQRAEQEKANFQVLVEDIIGAILVGKDFGAFQAYLVPADHPERVSGVMTRGDGMSQGEQKKILGRFDVKPVIYAGL